MRDFIKKILRKCPCYRAPKFTLNADDIEGDLHLR